MSRIIILLSLLGAFEYHTCLGDTQTDDWRRQGFYRPRRNYPSQSQNDNTYQANRGQNYQSQSFSSDFSQSSIGTTNKQNERNHFGINYQHTEKQSAVSSNYSQPQYSFQGGSQNSQASDTSRTNFGQNYNQNVFGTSNQNTQRPNRFGFNTQNSFITGYNQKSESQNALGSASQNSFAASFSQNTHGANNGQNSFGTSFSRPSHKAVKTSSQPFGSFSQNTQTQNYFERNFNNHKSQNSFANIGQSIQPQNSFGNFQSQNAFSALGSNSAFTKGHKYQGPDYLPPKRFMAPEYLPPKEPSTTTTRRPFYTTTTTKRPFYTTTTTMRPIYSTTTTRRPFYTRTTNKRPLYTTTTTKRPIYSTTTTKRPILTTTTTKRPIFTTTTTIRPTYTPRYLPAMAMQVPEPEDDDEEIVDQFATTTPKPVVAPAMAMIVRPEEDDPTTTPSTTTKPSTTTSTTPSTTTSTTTTTTPSTTTSITITTTPSTTTSTSPSTTTSTTPFTTTSTTPSTTTSTTPFTTTSTTPSTTTSTSPSTTTSTTPFTTTSTTPSTTTSTTPFTTTSTTPSTTTSTTPSTTTSTTLYTTTSTTTPDPNRNRIEEESSPTTPPPEITTLSTTTFKAPEYLPPDNTTRKPLLPPPAPAMGDPVPPEPECDPLDPSTYPSEIDQRYFGDLPCAPITTTTVKTPYRGPLYLPPPPEELCVPKTRVRRSTEETLRLADLAGKPRPVWYAGIYKKVTDPYYPICGGSIVREDIVISAAHCFWNDERGKEKAELFAVAASKIYKPWKDPMDKKAQKSDVLDITIPPRYLGVKASFQEDIAILKLATPFKYTRGVRPICVDFDVGLDRQQLKNGHYGTIAGWGYTDSVGTPTQRLLWLELPYIEIDKCIRDSEESFLKYITSDKVCAGENDTGKALCRGDSGGGLAFWQGPASHATPYLRGVASTAPTDKNAACNVFAYGSFTWLYAHRTFLRDHLPDIEKCRFWE